MNNPFALVVAEESAADDAEQAVAPLIDYPRMRMGQAVALMGMQVHDYVTKSAIGPMVFSGAAAYGSTSLGRNVEFVDAGVLPGYFATRLIEPAEKEMLGTLTEERLTLEPPDLETLFDVLADLWIEQTQYESSFTYIFTHRAYQQILRLGTLIVPLALRRLEAEPERWTIALSSATGENPVPQHASAEEAVDAWRAWAASRGYLNEG